MTTLEVNITTFVDPVADLPESTQPNRRQFLRTTLLASGGILSASAPAALARLSERQAGLEGKLLALAGSLDGNAVVAGDPAYEGIRRAGSFNPETDRHPVLIIQCRTPGDVARGIEFSRSNDLELAVRSGGHDVLGQSVSDGVVIDLGMMQQLELDPELRRVRVGAGVRVGRLEYAQGEAGLAVPLACHPGVAVSGLTLGGGLGWILGKYGTTADHVVAMDVVTADRQHLRVDGDTHGDLFWALRGGGGNFGVVTALEYQLQRLDLVTGGFLVYPLESLGDVLAFFQKTMVNAPDELMIELSTSPTNPPMLVATVCHCGTEAEARAALAPIRRFGPPLFDGVRTTPLRELTAITQEARDFLAAHSTLTPPPEPAGDGRYNHWRGASISGWTSGAIEVFVDRINQAPPGWSLGIGHFMHGAPTRVPSDATALPREEGQSSYFFNVNWTRSIESAAYMGWVDESIDAMAPFNDPGAYINYLSDNSEDAVSISYRENYGRLQQLKARVDPDNLFHLNRNIRA